MTVNKNYTLTHTHKFERNLSIEKTAKAFKINRFSASCEKSSKENKSISLLHTIRQNPTMTMGDDVPVSTLVLPILLRPILSQVRNLFTVQKYHLFSVCHMKHTVFSGK